MNLREVRKKTKSIKNVKKITKAMQMVSAVKMRKAQALEMESRPYRDGLKALIARLSRKMDMSEIELLKVDMSNAKKDLLILITSNKGLAGPFNVNLFRYLLKNKVAFETTDFIVLGGKGAQFLSRIERTDILASYTSNHAVTEASAIFDFALDKYKTGAYKSVSIVYNKFLSTVKSEVAHEVLLPFSAVAEEIDEAKAGHVDDKSAAQEYTVEPSPKEILEQLLLNVVENNIRGAIISSEAVEHAARMMAMKSATDSATDIIHSLTLLANRLRQEKITNELLDMITAKESVDVS